jgi:hypothetical protein
MGNGPSVSQSVVSLGQDCPIDPSKVPKSFDGNFDGRRNRQRRDSIRIKPLRLHCIQHVCPARSPARSTGMPLSACKKIIGRRITHNHVSDARAGRPPTADRRPPANTRTHAAGNEEIRYCIGLDTTIPCDNLCGTAGVVSNSSSLKRLLRRTM